MVDLQRAAVAEVHQAIREGGNEVTGIVTRNGCIQSFFALAANVRNPQRFQRVDATL
jgi:hypothetical protein